jgi:nicotinamide mononucleotide adenylyltransferase
MHKTNNQPSSIKEPKWGKITHIKSSLEPKDSQYALFIGRWQPLHKGHKALFDRALKNGKKVCIAIRDIEPDEKNPYSAEIVKQNISLIYDQQIIDGSVRVIVIPDICSVEFGRGVGYDIIEHIPPLEIGNISATKIREEMRRDGKL